MKDSGGAALCTLISPQQWSAKNWSNQEYPFDLWNAFYPLIRPLITVRSWQRKKLSNTLFWTAMRNPPARTQLLILVLSRFSMCHHEKPKVSLRRATIRPRLQVPQNPYKIKKKKIKRKRRQENVAQPQFINHPGGEMEEFSLLHYFSPIWRLMECNDGTPSIRGVWKGSQKAVVKISSRCYMRLIYGTVNCGSAASWKRRCRRLNF